MKKRHIMIWTILGLLVISVGIVLINCMKATEENSISKELIDLTSAITEFNSESIATEYYNRDQLDEMLAVRKDRVEVDEYFGKPRFVIDFSKNIHSSKAGELIYIYAYDEEALRLLDRKQYGEGFWISFIDNNISDWDIANPSITVEPYSQKRLDEMLSRGMTIEDVKSLLGEPSTISRKHRIITSIIYNYRTDNQDTENGLVDIYASIDFDENGFVTRWTVASIDSKSSGVIW